MRLLNSSTKELRSFFEDSTPSYAILSHVWGVQEVTLQQLEALTVSRDERSSHLVQETDGYRKIDGCCALARGNGFEWVWIDTCCIDKINSTELSEAINSMFRWYKEAAVCYVYLSDVSLPQDVHASGSSFRKSQWFTRGWTLQELVAPKVVEFYDSSWNFIETRSSLRGIIEDVTGISTEYFINKSLYEASIAQRMSWAARRQTTKTEDMAYCLLGIFDVNMSLLYGEGRKAFQRLQEEIIKHSNDQSILAWGYGLPQENTLDELSPLAKWPSDFAQCGKIIPCEAWRPSDATGFEKVKAGVRIELPLVISELRLQRRSQHIVYGLLNCRLIDNFTDLIAIPIGSSQNKLFRFGKDLCAERWRHPPPTLYNYMLYSRRASMHTIIMTEDRFLKSSATTTLFPATTPMKNVPSLLQPFLIEELGDFAFASSRLDPSLRLIKGNRHTLVWEKIQSGPPIPRRARKAFFHYKTTCGSDQENENIILQVELSEAKPRVKCFVAFYSDNVALKDLSTDDLKRLNWNQKVQSKVATVTIAAQPRSVIVLGVPTGVVTLTGATSNRTTPPSQIRRSVISLTDTFYFLGMQILTTLLTRRLFLHPLILIVLVLIIGLITTGILFPIVLFPFLVITVVIFLFSSKTISQVLWRLWVGGLFVALEVPSIGNLIQLAT